MAKHKSCPFHFESESTDAVQKSAYGIVQFQEFLKVVAQKTYKKD